MTVWMVCLVMFGAGEKHGHVYCPVDAPAFLYRTERACWEDVEHGTADLPHIPALPPEYASRFGIKCALQTVHAP